ncbi:MAG: TIGR01212 family radical SAM protein [Eubacterium sp.]|nr:TIGR01212 family radical SAM protein [Eubacterium sp.]MDD7209294.1 TIGR01212 family radical SAM protein [Lachnospiraceae bacterium]MDY5497338.1 TIGR01212 family radical SAM protein [Anaerobutyricum sp.]
MGKEIYYAYSKYLKAKYGEKVYKLPVNLPVSCPNRKEGAGCLFCAREGTGFEAVDCTLPISEQMRISRDRMEKRYHAHKFIAYFQNYTNTFLPLEQLMKYMKEAAQMEDIVEISISTRPDCIRKDYLEAFKKFRDRTGIEISLELGLQTVNYHTLEKMNRGHGLAEFINAVLLTEPYRFPVCVHMILNLPGDEMEDAKESARILSALPVTMVKLHSLYIPKNSPLSEEYEHGKIAICTKEEYLKRLMEFVSLLRPDIVLERLFSRIPEKDSSFCNWGCSWWKLMDEWELLMRKNERYQGIYFNYLNGSALNRWEM